MHCSKQPHNTVQLCAAWGWRPRLGAWLREMWLEGEKRDRERCQHVLELHRPHKTDQAMAVQWAQPYTVMPRVALAKQST